MSGEVLSVRLGPDKARWEKHCASIGVPPSTALRRAIARELDGEPEPAAPKPVRQVRPRPEGEGKRRFEVLLTDSELTAIGARAEAEECSRRRWIVDVIRIALTGEIQPSTRELELLGESNYQLQAIGRNLNQIARRLNENQHVDDLVEVMVERLAERIDTHTDLVNTAMRASVDRWVIE